MPEVDAVLVPLIVYPPQLREMLLAAIRTASLEQEMFPVKVVELNTDIPQNCLGQTVEEPGSG